MNLAGLHHVTMITGDAQENVRFYADLLGLRFVKKTVNFDAPEAYHLYFGDEQGTPGSILTWFEFPGAARGRAGVGMIHTLQLGVASEASLDFWQERLGDAARRGERKPALRGLRRARPRARGRRARQPAATRRSTPRSRPSTPSSASRARAPTPSTPHVEEKHADRRAGLHPRGGRRVRPGGLRAPLPLGLRPRARDAQRAGRRHRPPHRLGHARRRAARLAGADPRGRRLRHRASATATTSARSTSASRAACCSRSPP